MTDIHLCRTRSSGNRADSPETRLRCTGCPGTRPPRSPRACPGSSPRTWRWPCWPGCRRSRRHGVGVNLTLAGQPVLISARRRPGCPARGQTGPKIPAW